MLKIAVLVSGGGTNLQALIDAQKANALGAGEICVVISTKKRAFALERAKSAGIATQVVSPKSYADVHEFSRALELQLEEYKPQLIVLAGFLSIVDAGFCEKYPYTINVHPALIPSFCGKGMYGLRVHEAALARGVKVSGATVHFVNAIPDGGRIIFQKSVDVPEGSTPESLQKKIMRECEQPLLVEAVRLICQNSLHP